MRRSRREAGLGAWWAPQFHMQHRWLQLQMRPAFYAALSAASFAIPAAPFPALQLLSPGASHSSPLQLADTPTAWPASHPPSPTRSPPQFAGAIGYAAFSELLLSPKEYQVIVALTCNSQLLACACTS